ncbi:tyrosyl-tRNA synthetase [Roseibium limicola]|uniref:Tyrosyl-tRNA synthetase n=1 Tax=Roseibium limicola TaxID=2816037 RepID=A0A939EMQ8_9HYPH|nr:tyrosyl-tRNA synthetase [Roseibium limicola]MBO0345282.1 tyrosyl-tRNA synthetase [Roseibium limicola]
MFKKIAASTLTAAIIATSAMAVSTSSASAKNGRNAGIFAAGAIIGLATGAIVASTARPSHANPRPVYVEPRRRCHNEPVQRWNPYRGHYEVVAYKRVCY